MVIYVLDASALLRFLFAEAGDRRVNDLLNFALAEKARVLISSINWAEVVNKVARRQGREFAEALGGTLAHFGVDVVAASALRATRAGLLVAQYKLGYADAFCTELASDSSNHVLVTADFDFKIVEHLVKVEFLPTKSPS